MLVLSSSAADQLWLPTHLIFLLFSVFTFKKPKMHLADRAKEGHFSRRRSSTMAYVWNRVQTHKANRFAKLLRPDVIICFCLLAKKVQHSKVVGRPRTRATVFSIANCGGPQ